MTVAYALLFLVEALVFTALAIAALMCISVLLFELLGFAWEVAIRPAARALGWPFRTWRSWRAGRCRQLLKQPRCDHGRVRDLCDECCPF